MEVAVNSLITLLLIQLCLVHTTACYDKVFWGSLDPEPNRVTIMAPLTYRILFLT